MNGKYLLKLTSFAVSSILLNTLSFLKMKLIKTIVVPMNTVSQKIGLIYSSKPLASQKMLKLIEIVLTEYKRTVVI